MVPPHTLRRYLAKLLFTTIVPLLALAGLLTFQVVSSERETRLQGMKDLAHTLSSAVEAEASQTLLALQLVADGLPAEGIDLVETRARFERARALHGQWSTMALFAADGTRVLDMRAPQGEATPAGRPMQPEMAAAVRAGRVYISDVVVSSTSGKPTVFFAVPVLRQGVPAYAIAATMEFDAWTDWLKQRIPEGTIAAIDDRASVIFARSERPEAFAGKPATEGLRQAYANAPSGLLRNLNREDAEIFVAYATSTLTGWHTLVIVPARVVDAGPLKFGLAFAATTAAFLLVTLVATFVMARPLARGITHLGDSIQRVGRGEQPAQASSPIAEINQAEQAARHAAQRLEAARTELVRQREELRTMLDLLPVGVAVAHDAQASEITVSPRFEQMMTPQRRPAAPGSGPDRDAVPYRFLRAGQPVPPEALPLHRVARTGTELRDEEFDVEGEDGTLLHMLVNAAPLFDTAGQVRGAIAAHIDVTSLKRAQQSLQQADRQKNEFLTTLAHELRNPMAPIRYAAALLRRDAGPEMIEQARGTIERQSAHMARLLDDLIDLSRISRNVIELQREVVDLRGIVQAAVDNARPLAEEQGHTLLLQAAPGPMWVNGDPARLLQIVDNLLSNACKYTPQGGRIVVATSTSADRCEVRVTDNGVGLTPDMIPQMFALFGQVHRSLSVARRGLGIGLTVVRRLVELHEGTLAVHSDGLGTGATFTVKLPQAAAHAVGALAGRKPERAAATTPVHVLVVDDNVDAAEMLTVVLRSSGFEARTAHSAEAALSLAAVWRPDVAILDIGLPGMSGHELAQQLRRQPGGDTLLLIAVTGWGQPEDRDRTAGAGFNAHFVKPVDADELIRVMEAFAAARTDSGRPERPAAAGI